MKRFVIAVATLAVLLTAGLAVAAEPAPAPAADAGLQPVPDQQPPQQQQVYYQSQPQQQYYYDNYSYQQPQSQGFWGRMMELERRKNNAILRFFGLR
jgi:hypothetical protein